MSSPLASARKILHSVSSMRLDGFDIGAALFACSHGVPELSSSVHTRLTVVDRLVFPLSFCFWPELDWPRLGAKVVWVKTSGCSKTVTGLLGPFHRTSAVALHWHPAEQLRLHTLVRGPLGTSRVAAALIPAG